uniref:MSP domain-containing protein n=1 Tax=Parastrongyloides trichosuri TaxID=131310 RepID=A0A0N5A258_PARTI
MAALNVDPPGSEMPAAGGKTTHKVGNAGATRLAFKVKSSNNTHIRLKPVFGFVDPGAQTDLEITRLEGPPKEDKLVIQFKEAAADAADPAALFKEGPIAGEVIVPVSAK